MTGLDLLALQLAGSFDRLLDGIGRAEGEGWSSAVFEGANPAGFTLWHCARTIDWTVHCAILGVEEMARQPEWRERVGGDGLFGAGTTPQAALRIPQQVGPADVRDYLAALRPAVLAWFEQQDAGSVDAVPDFRANQERAGYDQPAVWEAIADLEGIPAWQILARPAIAHVRTHMGEVDVLLQAISRSTPSATP